MFRIVICAICTLVLTFAAHAQSNSVEQVLQEIEQNNTQLQAYRSLAESRGSQLRATNGLPQLDVLGYYMPFGEHSTADYYEVEIAQSFDFPSVYSARKDLIELQQDELMIDFDQKRQDILLPAKLLCLELIHLNKQREVVAGRVDQAKQVMEQTQRLFQDEQLSVIELNKAKVGWLQIKYSLDQLNNEQAILLSRLEKLNGGQTVILEDTTYMLAVALPSFEVLWAEREVSDPTLRALAQKERVAAQQLTVAKRSNLPGILAGYNAQGFRGEYYAGFLAGVSIPLWKSGAKVNAAKALTDYQQHYTSAVLQEARGSLSEQYQRYELLQSGLEEYRSTLAALGNDRFLKEAYELGELSFIQYYDEAQFYWQAYDDMLLMEKELYQLQSELAKHQL